MAGPPVPPNERLLLAQPNGSVEYAVRLDCTSESKEWLESLPENDQAGFDVLFQKVLMHRTSMNKKQFRKLKGFDQIYEFKRRGQRLFCFLSGRRYLLTHGKKKASKSKVKTEGKHAEMIAQEHIERESKERSQHRRNN